MCKIPTQKHKALQQMTKRVYNYKCQEKEQSELIRNNMSSKEDTGTRKALGGNQN